MHGLLCALPGVERYDLVSMQDFSGFRVVTLLPRYKPCYPPPSEWEPDAPPAVDPRPLGAPADALPALMVAGHTAPLPPFRPLLFIRTPSLGLFSAPIQGPFADPIQGLFSFSWLHWCLSRRKRASLFKAVLLSLVNTEGSNSCWLQMFRVCVYMQG